MRRVQIVGAGECGLALAHRLLDGGASVTLVTDRAADAVLAGSVTSTQVKFCDTLVLETHAGLGHWDGTAPAIRGIRFAMVADRAELIGWCGRFSRPARSVDQRTAFAAWLTGFVDAGGVLEVAEPSVAELDRRVAEHDLTVITRASGELAGYFPADPSWTVPAAPMRSLTALYLDGVSADPDDFGSYTALPGLGEIVSYPGLTGAPGHERSCEMVLVEALPGGALDVFTPDSTPAQRKRQFDQLVRDRLPAAVADRYRDAELTDQGATLVGAVAPKMRLPIGTLPSGTPVLGGGDVVCRMDPGGAQGANSAAHCAHHYSAAILDHPGRYDRDWMATTAQPWLTDIAHPAARWTMTVLDPPPAMQTMMQAAQHDSALADAFAETFVRPAKLAEFTNAAP